MAKLPYVMNRSEAGIAFSNPYFVNNTGPAGLVWDSGNMSIVDDPLGTRGDVLEVKHYAGMYDLGKSDVLPKRPSGCSVMITGAFSGLNEFYASMDVYFPPGFKHNWACHYWSFLSPSFTASVDPALLGKQMACFFQMSGPDSYNDLSTFKFANRPATLSFYYYDANGAQKHKFFNPKDPTSPHSDGRSGPDNEYYAINNGVWTSLEMYVKLNTTGFIADGQAPNGVMKGWVNGQLMLDLNNRQWIDDTDKTVKVSRAQFQTWYGGNGQEWAAHENQSILFDRVSIASTSLTH